MAEASGKPDPEPQEPPAPPKPNVIRFNIGGPADDHSLCTRMVERAKKGKSRWNMRLYPASWSHPGIHSYVSLMCAIFTTDKRVQEMVSFIEELGCPLDLNKVVECKPCGVAATGGFIQNTKNLPEGQYTPKVRRHSIYS